MLTRGHPRQEKHQRMLDPEPVASTKRPKTRSEEEPSLAPTWNSDPEAPAPSAAAEAKTPTLYAMEIGASHFQLMYKKPGKEWTCKTWPALGDNWGMESRNVIPTMVALEHAPKNEEVPTYYGREALDIAKTSSRFDTFRYLKLAYVDDADNRLPSLIKRTLKQQEKLARSYGWRSKGIASLFFDNALKELSKDDGKTAVLYFNVIDIWPNAVSQKLLDRFQELLPGVKIHAIDECLSSVFGTHHGEASGNCALLTVDCGHSTTNVCRLRPSKKERHYQIEDYEPLPLGAGIINAAAEEEVRNINRIRQRNLEQDVLNVSCFVDALKHDMGNCDSSSFGYNEDEWQRIIKAAKDANVKLDRERIQVIDSLLGKNKVEAPRERIKVILTGGASQSKTFQDGLRDMVSRRYPNVEVCPTGSWYVLPV
ncbi:hypothetical protein KC343_g272 [Hortaea werneckii]|nr:hypothetical protein KC352_g3107 [Hortaea werneckii]KAI7572987.1 hypothetical protein KC317_g274 [Hortaea werneckii]KAI7628063.1 hypothetical protein KC346_g418 [Hortaea werneckii]KAI7638150.1 hypothetical protein KC343_g272 [Hortaea werneckii]KAI7683626.1 hypothetical protein KC319_g371 [Hortaea werneckii]